MQKHLLAPLHNCSSATDDCYGCGVFYAVDLVTTSSASSCGYQRGVHLRFGLFMPSCGSCVCILPKAPAR